MSNVRYWIDKGFSGTTLEIKKIELVKETAKTFKIIDTHSYYKRPQTLRKPEELVFTELVHAQEKFTELVQIKLQSMRERILQIEADAAKHLEESKGLA